MRAIVGLSLAVVMNGARAPDPCDLLTREAASQLLGQAATMTPSGPEPDEETGGTRTGCVYQAGGRMLIVMRVVFASAAAAREATTRELVGERLGEEGATVAEESGIGDRVLWAYTPIAAEYMVVKGSSVLGLVLGGMPEAPSAYQAQLRAAAVSAAAKL